MEKKEKKTRYSDKELEEFSEIISKKIAETKETLHELRGSCINENGTDETGRTSNTLEDGSKTLLQKENDRDVERLSDYLVKLENAEIRIKQKSYGICRKTGELIPKERLRATPHATTTIEGKKLEKKFKQPTITAGFEFTI